LSTKDSGVEGEPMSTETNCRVS